MKIFSTQQIRDIDSKTIAYDKISSLQLMKKAAKAFFDWFVNQNYDETKPIAVVCGTGNNGGDGLVVARLLLKSGYRVRVWILEYSEKYAKDCARNIQVAQEEKILIHKIISEKDIPDFSNSALIIDAIFGTGLTREIEGFPRTCIQRMNESEKPIISIDVPSGMFLDKKTTFAVQASETVTLEIPKLALFLPENHQFAGNVSLVPIGLNKKAISETGTNQFYIEKEDIKKIIKPLSKFAHKGTFGHALIIGGSLGKSGSVCLASKAALKSGCGLVTAYIPQCGKQVIESNLPEAMFIVDNSENHISNITFELKPDAIGVGVGLGKHPETKETFYHFLQKNTFPLVVDADGINLLSENKDWLKLLPPQTILTPHPKELSRLIGDWNDDFEKIEKTKTLSAKYRLIVVIKGAYTMTVSGEQLYLNSSGTPALATAGSGDVLTGMITSLLAQGYLPIEAVRAAIYLHGSTADITRQKIHPRSFIASDIIENIGNAYFEMEK